MVRTYYALQNIEGYFLGSQGWETSHMKFPTTTFDSYTEAVDKLNEYRLGLAFVMANYKAYGYAGRPNNKCHLYRALENVNVVRLDVQTVKHDA